MTSESSSCCCSGNPTETQDADLLYCFLEIVGGLVIYTYLHPPTHHQELMKSAVGSCGSLSLLFMMVVVMV